MIELLVGSEAAVNGFGGYEMWLSTAGVMLCDRYDFSTMSDDLSFGCFESATECFTVATSFNNHARPVICLNYSAELVDVSGVLTVQ